jgi:hypothetical protein
MKFAVVFAVIIAANVFANPTERSGDTQVIEVNFECREIPE